MILNLVFIGLIYFLKNQLVDSVIFCRTNENGRSFDWVYIYRPPAFQLNEKLAYYYKTSDDSTDEFQISKEDLFNSRKSSIRATLAPFYIGENANLEYSYIQYNSAIPKGTTASSLNSKGSSEKYGSGKGALIWHKDSQTAVWIIHSIPEFPIEFSSTLFKQKTYSVTNGHFFLCLEIRVYEVGEIMKHLIFGNAKVYGRNLLEDDISYDYELLRKAQISVNPMSYYTRTQSTNSLSSLKRTQSANSLSSLKRTQSTNILPSLKKTQSLSSLKRKQSLSEVSHEKENSFHALSTIGQKKYKIITISFKDFGGLWNKVQKNLDPTNKNLKFYIKSSYSSNSNRDKHLKIKPICLNSKLIDILEIKIGDKEWKQLDDSKYGVSENGNWFCVTDLDRNYFTRSAGSSVCLSNKQLRNAVVSSIKKTNCRF